MKKKELLIIFVLAVLVTGLVCFFQGIRGDYGWPLPFLHIMLPVPIQWFPLNFLLDLLFWFLVLAGGWWVVKKIGQR